MKINNCSHFDPWGRVGIAFNIAINRGRYYEKIDRKVGTHVEAFSNSKIFNFSKSGTQLVGWGLQGRRFFFNQN